MSSEKGYCIFCSKYFLNLDKHKHSNTHRKRVTSKTIALKEYKNSQRCECCNLYYKNMYKDFYTYCPLCYANGRRVGYDEKKLSFFRD